MSERDAGARPNLLVIMADQWRHDWLGAAGTVGVSTPNADALAARGMRFTSACTNAAVCVPARLSLATGLEPERLGTLDNNAVLPSWQATYYQRLRDHGYRTGVVGKLDLAKSDSYNGRRGDRPAVFRWGFTHPVEAEGKMHAGRAPKGRPLGPYGYWLEERGLFSRFTSDYAKRLGAMRGRSDGLRSRTGPPYAGDDLYRDSVLPADAVEDHWIGQRAAEWVLDVPDDFPWHLFVSFVGPHDPFDPPAAWADRFRHAQVPDPVPPATSGKPGNVSRGEWQLSGEQVVVARRQYSAAVALIDEQVGRILDAVEQRGFGENTVVALTSDHGEMLGDLGLFQKSVPYEAAMRVPLIIAGPGVRPGVSDALVELADLNPTLCEFAGLDAQPGIDARSVLPLLTSDDPGPHRTVTLCSEQHYLAIRSAAGKYVKNTHTHPLTAPDDPDEVYDLAADPAERHNLLLEDPQRAAAIRDALIDAAKAAGHQLSRLSAEQARPSAPDAGQLSPEGAE